MNIFNLLVKQKIKNYNKIALVIDEEEYSYGKLTDKIIKLISFFKKNGINHKSKILILEDNSIIQILTLFAASYLNITIIPLGTSYNPHQVKDFDISHPQIKLIFVPHHCVEIDETLIQN